MAPAPRRPTGTRPRSCCRARTARCSRMRSFTSVRPSWSSSRMRAASGDVEVVLGDDAPGDLEDGVEPGPDPAVLGVLLGGPLQLVDSRAGRPCARPREGRVPRSWPGSRRRCPRRRCRRGSSSSLRMASSWRRRRNSRWVFSMPSSTFDLIWSRSVRSAKVSRAQPMTRRSRASTSTVSRTSTFWASVRSGE